MIESDLLDVYTKVLSPWNLIYKNFKKRVIAYIVCILVMFFSLIILGAVKGWNNWILIANFVFCTIIFYWSLNYFILRVAKEHSKNIYGATFQSNEWTMFICLAIRNYLYKQNILVGDRDLNIESLDFLISMLEKRKEEMQRTSIINYFSACGALFLILFVPVWSALNSFFYNKGNFSVEQAYGYLGMVTVILIMVICGIWGIIWRLFILELVSLKIDQVSRLLRCVETIKFMLKNNEYKKSNEIKVNLEKFEELLVEYNRK